MKKLLWVLVVGTGIFFGCKKDFSTAGYHTVKDRNFEFNTYSARIKTYSRPVDSVFGEAPQLLNLGVYPHSAFGLSEADVLIQFNANPALGSVHFENADSILFVELRIPYFARKKKQASDTIPQYELDSIFGEGPIRISAYESKYYLYPYDPSEELVSPQHFYSDFDFLSKTGNLLGRQESFVPTPDLLVDTLHTNGLAYIPDEEISVMASGDTLPPHYIIRLDTNYFKQKFFDQPNRNLLTDNILFKNYFRGIYLHVESINDDGTLMLLNPEKIHLVLAYRYAYRNTNGTPDDPSDDFIDHAYEKVLLFPSKIVQHYQKDFYPSVVQKLENPDTEAGEEKIYVKGTAGSMGVIKLFDPEELIRLRTNNWLINQANLRLYVDETEMAEIDDKELPAQLFLYKLHGDRFLADLQTSTVEGYGLDLQTVLRVYDGKLKKDENGLRYYQFNITRHIRNILRRDSANVPLGLRVSAPLEYYILHSTTLEDTDGWLPYGTVLQGNLSADKPAELIIYYTRPEEE